MTAIIPQCAKQIPNKTAPASGSAEYVAWTATYAAPGCKDFIVDVSNNSSISATVTVDGTYSAADCASLVANIQLVEYDSVENDCSDQPRGCKPTWVTTPNVLAETRATGQWNGSTCSFVNPSISRSWSESFDASSVRLLVSSYLDRSNGPYEPVILSITAH
jgi:hypothetical protein